MYRYDFGDSHRPARFTEKVEVPPETTTTREKQRRLVEHEITIASDVFFELDRFEVLDSGMQSLREIANTISGKRILGVIEVVGNTCDLASDAYNQRLSERRAAAVTDVLTGFGVDAALIRDRGDGESNPQFPNDGEPNRSKNRRVDIRFVTVREDYEDVEVDVPAEVQWQTREVAREPAWLRRALRNPVTHKRRVDAYQFQTVASETVAGAIVFINRPPAAVDDSISVDENSGGTPVEVLVNDSDPDGDSLIITAVTDPAHGSVVNNGG
jgi:outer membrane protein OmpA-like peptidoglycan-associated protein